MIKPDRFPSDKTLPILYFDGGSKGNPGVAAGAAVIVMPDGQSYTVSEFIAFATNNEAEYTGLIVGLRKAKELGIQELEVRGDSQLVINQINGLWKIKSENLKQFYNKSFALFKTFQKININWIERSQNHLADTAVNHCIKQELKPQKQDKKLEVNSGETNLQLLLKSIKPILKEGEFVFCSVSKYDLIQLTLTPIGQFIEEEGVTLILSKEQADKTGLAYEYIARMITLSVHSSLDAVGFLAAITAKLAENSISVNPISAYYHDHLFVPTGKADEAMKLLTELGVRGIFSEQ